MNEIILTFDKTLIAIAGYEYGNKIFEEQVKSKYKSGEKNIIIFPEQIEYVAISFVQGFLKDLLKEYEIDKILKEIDIRGNKNFVSKFYRVI